MHNSGGCPGSVGEIPEMAGNPIRTQQPAVSWPKLQRLKNSFEENGWDPEAEPVKIDEENNVIVEGNHRYIAGKMSGVKVPRVPGVSRGSGIPIRDVAIDPVNWGGF